jgi:Ca2+-binding EF-hand superfamily protein
MKQRLFAGLVLAAALAAGAATATTPEEAFQTLDADGNGAVSRAEFLTLRAQMFATIDADQSGTLTAEEIETAGAGHARTSQMPANGRIWERDANGDGLLTLAEFTSQTPGFERADRNGDGSLSPAEFNRVARILARLSR